MSAVVKRAIGLTLLGALVVAWAVTLRPQALGGPAVFVAVRGSSMLPTYQHGDLVVVESASHYVIGDVVAYRVPNGEVGAGKVVIHRIVGGDATHGFTLQGDHNAAPDPWFPRSADMVGVATVRVPNVGGLISFVRQPITLAGLAAGLTVAFILARPGPPSLRPQPQETPRRSPRRQALAPGEIEP
jgi:signal peptidase I